MAWNEPGGNNQDPWGGKGGGNDGPPDLDEALKKLQDKINGIFGGGSSGGSTGGSSFSGASMGLVAVVVLVAYFLLGIYQLNEQERGVVLRLGVYKETVGPGLHWNPPLIDSVAKVRVTTEREYSTTRARNLMLTEDANMVELPLTVQYKIADAKSYVLNVKDPEISLRHATESAVRHVVGSSSLNEVLSEGRVRIADNVKVRIQQYLDEYGAGVQLVNVNIQEGRPPSAVKAAFDDVIAAKEDEERFINEAQAYSREVLPKARGKAQRMVEEASAYRDQVVAQSEGEAKRFEQLLTEYKKAPQVTRDRLYLDAVQNVMSNSSKVMIDVEGGNNMLYLPLDKIVNSASSPAAVQQISPEMVREISNRVTDQLRRETISNTRRRELR